MTYATFITGEMCISTDFSAQYEHKAFCTRTCEHPARSNMDVFIVTHSPREVDGGPAEGAAAWAGSSSVPLSSIDILGGLSL